METFSNFINQKAINENLVIKKLQFNTEENGVPVVKWKILVDSDLEDPRAAGKETYTNKERIKNLGFEWNKNYGKWISKEAFTDAEFFSELPKIRQSILSLNKDFDERSLEDIENDIEEHLDKPISGKLASLFDELKQKIAERQNSPEVQAFLQFRTKFTNRSFNNQLLIWMQAKERGVNPTHLEGKNVWKNKFGRRIKLGAKAFKIWIPVFNKEGKKSSVDDAPEKDQKTDDTSLSGFVLGNVFDVSETETIPGKENMYAQAPKWYDETTPDETTRYLYDALLSFAQEKNIEVSVSSDGLGGARGVSKLGSIQLLQENISTMLHELTHEILHTKEKRSELSKEIKELQAEGVTYLVLKHYGLPSDHALNYLALWNKDPENVKQNEEVIRQTAAQFIEYIDQKTMEVIEDDKKSNLSAVESFYDFLHKKQIQEVGTGTNAVAVFARPIGGGNLVRRTPVDMSFSKKKRKNSLKKR